MDMRAVIGVVNSDCRINVRKGRCAKLKFHFATLGNWMVVKLCSDHGIPDEKNTK